MMKLAVVSLALLLAAVAADNSLSNPLPQLPVQGILVHTIQDTTPPYITDVRCTNQDLDISSSSGFWSCTVQANDYGSPSSGVAVVRMAFWSPDFKKQSTGSCSAQSGGDQGFYSCSGSVQRWDYPGQWPLAWVNATDFQGNRASWFYDKTKNSQMYVTVTGPLDREPPALIGLRYSPVSLQLQNNGTQHQRFDWQANCTDNFSGCDDITVRWLVPNGNGDPFFAVTRSVSTGFSFEDGHWWTGNRFSQTVFVYQTDPVVDGDWPLYSVTISDNAGNFRTYYAGELAGLLNGGTNFPAVNVVGQTPPTPVVSTPAPQLISYNHDVSEIDLKLGTQRVCFNTTSTGDHFASTFIQHYIFFSGPTQHTVICGPNYATNPPPATPTQCYRSRILDPVTSAPLNQTLLRHCIDYRTFASMLREGYYALIGIGIRTPNGFALYGSCNAYNEITNINSGTCSSSGQSIGCRPSSVCGSPFGAASTLQVSAALMAALAFVVALLH